MKKNFCFSLTIVALILTGCGKGENSHLSSLESSTTFPPYSSAISIPTQTRDITNFEFGGMVGTEFENFYQLGWMAAECKFYNLDLRLIGDEGFLRTPTLDIKQDEIYVQMTSHITGLNDINDNAIGKSMTLSVYGLDENGEVVDTATYTHILTLEDKVNQSFPDFPAYSSTFSMPPYTVKLIGANIKKVKVELTKKISYLNDNGKTAGCNFSIKNLTIKESA